MDERYQVTTPENIPISYELAGLGSRFVASLIDNLILGVVEAGLFMILFFAIMLASYTESKTNLSPWTVLTWFNILVFLLSIIILTCYSLVFEIAWSGQTPGKRMTGIRVVRNDGSPITAVAAIIRNVMRLVDFLPMYYIIGVIVMLVDKKVRRLGDMAAGTICIKERQDVESARLTLASDLIADHGLVMEEGFANLNRLTYDDYHLIKEYLLRRDKLETEAAERLAGQIAGLISTKLEVDLDGEPKNDFLHRVGVALERKKWR